VIVLRGPWGDWDSPGEPTAITIGVLDGVHKGHRELLKRLDPTLLRTVLTFDPHPVEVLRPGTAPRLITTIDERIALLEAAGVGCVGVLDLGDIKEQTPREFIDRILVDLLSVSQLVVGSDFRFGRDRSGDVALLTGLGVDLGFRVEVIDLLEAAEMPVSSSRIRALVEQGRVAEAADLLGSRFRLSNEVVDGDKRGREIGYPTANLRPPHRKLIPGNGVYACFATVAGTTHRAAVNVGVRPTFGGEELLIEAFILDFDREIYGEQLTLEFVQYLRPELAFDGVGELVEQMAVDVDQARSILDSVPLRI
ncbi:MAG: bifunctional riboflavin kinase/FAD synthetase, partial [Acidimicrobiia bacterium]|jgi:riboflavin kinase/FMN adenylyltransferase